MLPNDTSQHNWQLGGEERDMGVGNLRGLSLTGLLAAALCPPLGKVNLNGVDYHPATNCSL